MEQYEPIKVLGEGSFGKVYLMKHCHTRDLVCTKVVKLKNIPPREQEACRNEVGLMRRMSHPNIVGYIDSFIYKNCLCIIMEYCDAGDLGDRVNGAKGRLLSESKIMTWFVQVALGLHYMHTHRILHRDIKTQNVFILSCGRVVLGDLGISKILGGTRDFARTCIGTPYYMSPEIFKNNPYNDKSDIWALGCLLYELLTLRHAFDSQSLNGLAGKIIKGKFPPVSSTYSNNVRCLVKDMLSTNPKRRPNTEQILRKVFVQTKVREFVNDLKTDTLPCQERAMGSLCDQLRDLRMEDFMPLDQPIMEEEEGGYDADEGGPNAPSPSQSDPALTASTSSRSSASGFLSFFRAQKHQLEVEEEKRIAAEMALSRLHRKAAERRQRLSFCRSPSPPGEGRPRDSVSPRIPSSPPVSPERAARDMTVPPSSDSRRPSLLQRLGNLATNQRRKSLTNQGSPAGVGSPDSVGSPGERRASRAPLVSAKINREVFDAAAAAAAQAAQVERDSEESIPEAGASAFGKSSARQPRRSLSRPKEALPYVHPHGRDQASTSTNPQPSPSGDSVFSADDHHMSRGTDSPPRQEASRTLEQFKIDTDSVRNERSHEMSASRGARSISPSQDAGHRMRGAMDSMYEDDEDLFRDLKKQTREHDVRGEDKDVHDREEELKRMLKEAEQRCQDLREGLERARALSGRQESMSTGPPSPDSLSVEPAVLEGMGLAPLSAKEDSPIPSAIPCATKQENRQDIHVSSQVSNFEDEPSPYCKSNLKGLQDPSSPIGKLVDRQEFLRQRCREGLGEGSFERAMQLLRSLQEGDCKVTVGGIQYDGNDVEQVEALLVTIIGRHKIHYWSFMNQLLLMS